MKTPEYRRIQCVNPVPSVRTFKLPKHRQPPRPTFWDILVTPNHGGDDHLVFTMKAENEATAKVLAKQRLMFGGKWKYFDLSTIRAEAVRV